MARSLLIVALAMVFGCTSAFVPQAAASTRHTSLQASKIDTQSAAAVLAGALMAGQVIAPLAAVAITRDEISQLSYSQTKGTGLANRCPEVKGDTPFKVKGGAEITELCIEPKAWGVETVSVNKGELKTSFLPSKMMTRQTYTLSDISGPLEQKDGKLTFTEKDGIDYAPTTVQTPGSERVPFLFTVKQLVAKFEKGGDTIAPGASWGGKFVVPSYRTGLFLDPKGRGMTTGYDQAQALPGIQTGESDEELKEENNKTFDVLDGSIEFEVTNVNADGEMGGVFVQTQASDTDLGGKVAKTVLSKGIWSAVVSQQ
jgi:photosystem II oxygen-evolving enhancer protein 1